MVVFDPFSFVAFVAVRQKKEPPVRNVALLRAMRGHFEKFSLPASAE